MALPRFKVFYQGRNTGHVVSARDPKHAIARSKSIGTTGSEGPVVGVTKLVGADAAKAAKGEWVRTRADGSKTSATGPYTFRPALKQVAAKAAAKRAMKTATQKPFKKGK